MFVSFGGVLGFRVWVGFWGSGFKGFGVSGGSRDMLLTPLHVYKFGTRQHNQNRIARSACRLPLGNRAVSGELFQESGSREL